MAADTILAALDQAPSAEELLEDSRAVIGGAVSWVWSRKESPPKPPSSRGDPDPQEQWRGLNTEGGESFTHITQPLAKQTNSPRPDGEGRGAGTKRCHNILSKISPFEQRNCDAGKKGKNDDTYTLKKQNKTGSHSCLRGGPGVGFNRKVINNIRWECVDRTREKLGERSKG